jgi:formyltetrahydrofolate synthetase
VSYSPEAEAQIEKYTRMGFEKLPICMAKTQYSFSHDATLKGAFDLNKHCRLQLGVYSKRSQAVC